MNRDKTYILNEMHLYELIYRILVCLFKIQSQNIWSERALESQLPNTRNPYLRNKETM